MRPLIAVTSDVEGRKYTLKRNYVDAVRAAGGLPVVLPSLADLDADDLGRFDGVLLSGGDDAHVEHWGFDRHPQAEPMDLLRHQGEVRVLEALDRRPDLPVLGVCLGMQLMALHAGGRLEQHLPDVLATADHHRGDRLHRVHGTLGTGDVASHHHQAVADPGRLRVLMHADDGVIEAVDDPTRPFALAVQWHPERTPDAALGAGVIRRLVEAARRRRD